MVKLYYRGMAEQNGKPKLGQSARLLGVRPTIDINIEQMPAWIFSLSAECGSDESSAHNFAEHFEGISWLLSNGLQCQSNGLQCQCRTDIFQDIEENWWCRTLRRRNLQSAHDIPQPENKLNELLAVS